MKAHLILVLVTGSLLAADGPGDSKKSDAQLKLCVQMIGKDRPSEFKSAAGSQTAYAVFERKP